MKCTRHNYGFTLIELVVFIVIMGIAGVALIASLNIVLKGVRVTGQETVAMQTATRCMEWYIGQRYFKGFDDAKSLDCVSPFVPSFCEDHDGYHIKVGVKCIELFRFSPYIEEYDTFKHVTVTVNGLGSASLSADLAFY